MGQIARDQLAPYASYCVAGMAVMDVLHYLRDHVYVSAALGRLSLPEDLRTTPAYLEYQQYRVRRRGRQGQIVERANRRGSQKHRAARAAGALRAIERSARTLSKHSCARVQTSPATPRSICSRKGRA